MKINKVHCLFEQSGTFKKEFLKLGIPAEDYDISNDFGETDIQCDLFREIEEAYEGRGSIFDEITGDDLVLSFFPCTRFEAQIQLFLSGNSFSQTKWSDEKKLVYALGIHEELARFYRIICHLFLVCIRGGIG